MVHVRPTKEKPDSKPAHLSNEDVVDEDSSTAGGNHIIIAININISINGTTYNKTWQHKTATRASSSVHACQKKAKPDSKPERPSNEDIFDDDITIVSGRNLDIYGITRKLTNIKSNTTIIWRENSSHSWTTTLNRREYLDVETVRAKTPRTNDPSQLEQTEIIYLQNTQVL